MFLDLLFNQVILTLLICFLSNIFHLRTLWILPYLTLGNMRICSALLSIRQDGRVDYDRHSPSAGQVVF